MYSLQLIAAGIAFTAVLVLLGEGLVVVHRGSGVTNFAAGAIGMLGAYAFYDMWPSGGFPWPVALLLGLATSAAIGAAMHFVIMRPLRDASITTKIIATLGVMILIQALADQFLAPGGLVRTAQSLLPTGAWYPVKSLPIGYAQLIMGGIAVVVTALLVLVQKRTRFGLATTAVAENTTVAAGMGLSPDLIAAGNWALGSALSALAMILIAPISGLSPDEMTLLVVPALCAALIGRFDSLMFTILGAVVIGIGEAWVGAFTTAPGWAEAAPLILVLVILMLRRRERHDRSEVAPRLPLVGSGRIGIGAAVVVVAAFVLMVVVGVTWLSALTTSLIFAICMLSVVVLTGYAGQLSLAQFGLSGIAAYFTALFAMRLGIPPWASIALAVIVAVFAGMVIAIPAFRTRGPTLAIATLAMVVVVYDLLLSQPTAFSWLGTANIPSLSIFGVQLSLLNGPRTYAIFIVIVVTVLSVGVANLRRSAMGRRLLATRANPQAASALGISPERAKIYAFAVAAVLAGICGGLFESQLQYPDFTAFGSSASITLVLQTTVGGLGFIGGPIIGGTGAEGGVGAQLLGHVISPSNWLNVITGALLLLTILQAPDGVIDLNLRQFAAQRNWVAKRVTGLHIKKDIYPKRKTDPFERALLAGTIRTGRRQPATVDVEDLVVTFGAVRAVDGVGLSIRPGEVVGLIGPNGAGKSTFIDAVCGSQPMTGGVVRLDGASIGGLSATQRAGLGLARSFQHLELFEDISVGENLLAASESPRWWEGATDLFWPRKPGITEAAALAVEYFGLREFLRSTPRDLDHGKRRLVAIARALASDPSVVMLDEPAAGLDLQERAELGRLLRQVASEWHIGVLLVEHDVQLVFRVCDRVVALVTGKIVAEGSPDVVRENPVLVEAYLGRGGNELPAAEAEPEGLAASGHDGFSAQESQS